MLRYNGFAENFIKTNPQFNAATLLTNFGNTNYHSLQVQTTIRRLPGIRDMQASYTWSKLLGRGGGYTNPVDRAGDYTLQTGDIRHDFRTNGTFELPIGPASCLRGNSSGVLAHLIGGWKMSWIIQLSSGTASSIAAATTLYANGVPDRVGAFDPSLGKVQWQSGALNGNYFGDQLHESYRSPVLGHRRQSALGVHPRRHHRRVRRRSCCRIRSPEFAVISDRTSSNCREPGRLTAASASGSS